MAGQGVARAIFFSALVGLGEGVHRTECTAALPRPLDAFGFESICADIEKRGCNNTVRVGLRFESETEPIVTEEISASGEPVCTSAADLALTPFNVINGACGSGWRICASLGSTLQMGVNFLAGCPTIEIDGCRAWGFGPELPAIKMNLDCFEAGFMCSRATDCDKCIASGPGDGGWGGCGWCAADESAGKKGTGKCMEGR